jgi:hypothetical protein
MFNIVLQGNFDDGQGAWIRPALRIDGVPPTVETV